MGDAVAGRWTGLRMMLVAVVAILLVSKLVFHIAGFTLALLLFWLLVVGFFIFLFCAGARTLRGG